MTSKEHSNAFCVQYFTTTKGFFYQLAGIDSNTVFHTDGRDVQMKLKWLHVG